jgi:hypothetical protein
MVHEMLMHLAGYKSLEYILISQSSIALDYLSASEISAVINMDIFRRCIFIINVFSGGVVNVGA